VSYTSHEHAHRFAAWAASSAASTSKLSRFKVEIGKTILEEAGFGADYLTTALPKADEMDSRHAAWRASIIAASLKHGCNFTHGVAAKLINVYLKAAFMMAFHKENLGIEGLHPPIDRTLLKALAEHDEDAVRRRQWRSLEKSGWSKFDSERYQGTIDLVRAERRGRPLWTVEEYWRGHQ